MPGGVQDGGGRAQHVGHAPRRAFAQCSPRTLAIRGGNGLGDAIYVQSIARYFADRGHAVEVCTRYPDVFLPLADRIAISPFRRDHIDKLAHYTARKRIAGTDQFRDCCIMCGIAEPVALDLGWTVQNGDLTKRVLRQRRPVVVVALPRAPMGRSDGFGKELLPDCGVIDRLIAMMASRYTVVQVGSGEALYRYRGIDMDLANRTTVSDVIDVVSVADAVLGYCSFLVPMAEAMNRPGLFVWSRRGLLARNPFVSGVTPQKVFHRDSSRAIVDDASDRDIAGALDGFCRQIDGRRAA